MILVEGLSLELGEFFIRDVSLKVSERDYFVLLGPTGAGKTVLLECIAGLVAPRCGLIRIGGRDMTRRGPEERGLGYLPQDYALFPHLTVRRNIAFGLGVRGKRLSAADAKVRELAALLGIGHLLDRDVFHLSGGECQRVALARALAVEPALLLLDEPLSALDEQTREELREELRRIHRRCRMTTLHVSHSIEEALVLADRIAVMNRGRIEQVGTPEEILSRPATEFVAGFMRSRNLLAGEAAPEDGAARVRIAGTELVSDSDVRGLVTAVVRPEEIELSPAPPARPSANHFRVRVETVVDLGGTCRIVLAAKTRICGGAESPARLHLTALCPRRRCQELEIAAGKEFHVHFPPRAVHLIPKEESPT